jgi:hypothetical protein
MRSRVRSSKIRDKAVLTSWQRDRRNTSVRVSRNDLSSGAALWDVVDIQLIPHRRPLHKVAVLADFVRSHGAIAFYGKAARFVSMSGALMVAIPALLLAV